MSVLKKVLDEGGFAVTIEMSPPKGSNFDEQMKIAEELKGWADCVNVTDMQSACLKASALGLCIRLKEIGMESILQVTGRDRNRVGIMGDLLSAAAFGIDTVLAVTGDHPVVGDCKSSKPVYDLDSVGILNMLSTMEITGRDCGGNPLTGEVPKFYKGAVVTPVYDPVYLQINKLRQKVDAGAEYIQTQAVYDMDSLKRFLDLVDRADIHTHMMLGVIPLKSAKMAAYMNRNVPGIEVPQQMIDRLEDAAAEGKARGIKGLPMQLGIEMAAEMVARVKDEHLCEGVHIMTVGAELNAPKVLKAAGLTANR